MALSGNPQGGRGVAKSDRVCQWEGGGGGEKPFKISVIIYEQHCEKAFITSSVLKIHALKSHHVIDYKEPVQGKNRLVKLNEFVKKKNIC